MLTGAWPNLHWNLFDYFLKPAGSYFGTKVGARSEHVSYDYEKRAVYLINHSLTRKGKRTVSMDLIDTSGKSLSHKKIKTQTKPNSSKQLAVVPGIDKIHDIAFLRLVLRDSSSTILSRNVYWLSPQEDVLDWDNSTWWYTPVTRYSDYRAIGRMQQASAKATMLALPQEGSMTRARLVLENESDVPAFFLSMNLLDEGSREDIVPVYWSDNCVTLWPRETLELVVNFNGTGRNVVVEIKGGNVANMSTRLGS